MLDGTTSGVIEFPRTVIHPQFNPANPEWIEFAGDPGPRMHRVRRDGTGLKCLDAHGNDESIVHETFLGRCRQRVANAALLLRSEFPGNAVVPVALCPGRRLRAGAQGRREGAFTELDGDGCGHRVWVAVDTSPPVVLPRRGDGGLRKRHVRMHPSLRRRNRLAALALRPRSRTGRGSSR